MSAPAFTPGPWRSFYKRKYDEWHVAMPYGAGQMLCPLASDGISAPDPSQREANARLIAAAPELYEALQQFVNGVETRMIDSPADETLANLTHRAKSALAKARGEQ